MKTLTFTREIPDDLYTAFTKMTRLSDMTLEDYCWLMMLMSARADTDDMNTSRAVQKWADNLFQSHIDAFWNEREKKGVPEQ